MGADTEDTGTISTTRLLSSIDAEEMGGLGATLTTDATMGWTEITRGVAAQTGGGNTGIKRYFDVTPTSNTGLDATLVFHYEESELNGLTEADLELWKSTDGGAHWEGVTGATLDAGANTLTKTDLGGFSRWTAGDSGNPLLVELLSFTALPLPDLAAVELRWERAAEVGCPGFRPCRAPLPSRPRNRARPCLAPPTRGQGRLALTRVSETRTMYNLFNGVRGSHCNLPLPEKRAISSRYVP